MKIAISTIGIEARGAGRKGRTSAGHEGGFTLLELLLVLGLAALAMGLSIPPLSRGLESARLSAAARELHATLRRARWQALRERRELRLLVDTAERWYQLAPGGKRRALPGDSTVLLVTAASEQSSRHRGGIRFYPDGSASGGRIGLRGAGYRYSIEVEWINGRARLRRDKEG